MIAPVIILPLTNQSNQFEYLDLLACEPLSFTKFVACDHLHFIVRPSVNSGFVNIITGVRHLVPQTVMNLQLSADFSAGLALGVTDLALGRLRFF